MKNRGTLEAYLEYLVYGLGIGLPPRLGQHFGRLSSGAVFYFCLGTVLGRKTLKIVISWDNRGFCQRLSKTILDRFGTAHVTLYEHTCRLQRMQKCWSLMCSHTVKFTFFYLYMCISLYQYKRRNTFESTGCHSRNYCLDCHQNAQIIAIQLWTSTYLYQISNTQYFYMFNK